MTLTEEIAAQVAAKKKAAAASSETRQQTSIKRMWAGFEYVFGEKPDKVEPRGKEGAVAHKDGLRFIATYGGASGPTLGLHVLCTCKHCGEVFESYESLGTLKNEYGPRHEGTPESRRERAIDELAKLAKRDFQPNGYDHDHVCYAGAVYSVRSRVRSAAKATGLSTYEIMQRVSLSL